MTNLLQKFEKEQIEKLISKKRIPTFRPGDTLKVTLKIVEGEKSRLQAYEGVCIARKNNSINSKFTVRKMSHGEGVERIFSLFSPNINSIEVVRKGDVKRAKLYYLRDRTGKSARIADRDRGDEADQYSLVEVSDQIEETQKEEKTNPIKEESVKTEENHPVSVAEEKTRVKEKSESSASDAAKTKDESKS